MDNNTLVSVVIPVYNGGRFLEEALKSVFAQDYRPLEVILVDDDSTDNSAEIARSYQEVRYIYQSNQGAAAARNTGIEAANGEFIAFLDADDQWLPGKLKIQIAYALKHPEVGYTVTMFRNFLETEQKQPAWLHPWELEGSQPGYLPSALVVRRVVFHQIGLFDPEFQVGEDTDWFFRAEAVGISRALLPDVLVARRIHTANLSAHKHEAHINQFKSLKKLIAQKRSNIHQLDRN